MQQKHLQRPASLLEANMLKLFDFHIPQSCDNSIVRHSNTNFECKTQQNQYKKDNEMVNGMQKTWMKFIFRMKTAKLRMAEPVAIIETVPHFLID